VYRYLTLPLALALFLPGLAAAADTPKAAATRKKLEKKISVDYKDTLFRDVMDDLKDQGDLTFLPDTKNGVNLNLKVTYKAQDKPLEEVLNAISDKADTGWYIITTNKAYEGSIKITRGKERGYEAGKEPDKTATPAKEKPEKTKPVTKEPPPEKTKPEVKENPDKTTPKPEDDADETERVAGRRLKLAKELQDDGKADKARDVLQDLVKKYPKTKAAEEAQKLLKDEK
jgi:hypothetical protein